MQNTLRNIIGRQRVGGGGFSFGNALQSDGIDDRVTIPNYNIAGSDGSFTINLWVKHMSPLTTISKTYLSFNFNSNIDNVNNYRLMISATLTSGQPRFQWFFDGFNPNTPIQNFSNLGINENDWFMMTIRKTASEIQFIFNANQSTKLTQARATNKGLNNLGNSAFFSRDNGSSPSDIVLDEISTFNIALTDSQISDLYNSGGGNFANLIGSPISYYRMNGVSGDLSAIDEISGNNGTLNNFNTSTCWVPH